MFFSQGAKIIPHIRESKNFNTFYSKKMNFQE